MQKQAETEKPTRIVIPPSLKRRRFFGSECYENFDLSDIKFPKKVRSSRNKRAFCWKVFNYCFDLILNDLIDNNIVFDFPTPNRSPARFSVRLVDGKRFQWKYKNGQYPGLDFLKTNFTAPELVYTYWNTRGQRTKPMFVFDENTRKRIIENANNGVYN